MAKTIIKHLPEMAKARSRVDSPRTFRNDIEPSPRLKEFAKGRKYLIKTFGCQANVRDEEIMAGMLEKAGFVKSPSEEEASLVIINTCAVRENAEEKVYGEIGKFKANATKDPNFILCLCGCMMQEEGVAVKLREIYHHVSIVFGTHNIDKLLDMLDEKIATKKSLIDVLSFSGDIVENLPSTRLDSYKAYVNITYGCDKFCTYCIVPYTRGRERSRAKEDILKECKELVEQGYQEITLLGQNVNSYGKDFKNGTSFAGILEDVAKLGVPRLRFMTSHPWDFTDEMLDVIAKYPNIMKCIHLPVQSGNDEILRLMGRRYTREDYLSLVRKIRDRMPECAITTDIIVGFPNETEEQFLDTLSLCKEVGYDAAFTFIYSPRKGTPAARIEDNVSPKDKHDRFNRLVNVVEEGVSSHSQKMVGKTYMVLVDGPSKKDSDVLSGYAENGKLIHFRGPVQLKGSIVPVKVTEDKTFSMFGELQIDPILFLAEKLRTAMDEEPLLKNYLAAKKAAEEDASLGKLRDEIESAQRAMMNFAASHEDTKFASKRKEYLSLMKEYESHPLILNLTSAKEELEPMLTLVAEALR
ncbi:MAG: tRNA (N6-isopentenyl adenosine(37)-C2)-methylthiotransferase MiaB [Erysipelotrichaceae bacterium]|jgi:tRNA-2-methylthio-N6-dimethylallyladenosine synthase|nr:tRNA (N6-isopentenyl adenosine(37)-C2)-methylthiotransferase MiaB [Erysipelotrichaceae bacterium]